MLYCGVWVDFIPVAILESLKNMVGSKGDSQRSTRIRGRLLSSSFTM